MIIRPEREESHEAGVRAALETITQARKDHARGSITEEGVRAAVLLATEVAVHHHILPLTLQETQKSTETLEERSLRRQRTLSVPRFFPRKEMKRRQLTIDDLHKQPINLIHIETPKTQQLMQADLNMIIIDLESRRSPTSIIATIGATTKVDLVQNTITLSIKEEKTTIRIITTTTIITTTADMINMIKEGRTHTTTNRNTLRSQRSSKDTKKEVQVEEELFHCLKKQPQRGFKTTHQKIRYHLIRENHTQINLIPKRCKLNNMGKRGHIHFRPTSGRKRDLKQTRNQKKNYRLREKKKKVSHNPWQSLTSNLRSLKNPKKQREVMLKNKKAAILPLKLWKDLIQDHQITEVRIPYFSKVKIKILMCLDDMRPRGTYLTQDNLIMKEATIEDLTNRMFLMTENPQQPHQTNL